MSFELHITTPEGEFFSGEADSVVAPGSDGYFGVLERHTPMLALLRPGLLKIGAAEQETLYAVGKGFLETTGFAVRLLVDYIEPARNPKEARRKLKEIESSIEVEQ